MNKARAVTICSSSRFHDLAKSLARDLQMQTSVTTFTPRFDFDEEQVVVPADLKQQLTTEFLGKIRRSSDIYVIATGGYTGRSVCIEIGFAYALGIPILMSEPPEEAAVSALVKEIVPFSEVLRYFADQPIDITGE
jgi:hypothetical protein